MGTLCFWAMYPRKEKTTKPEEKLVSELTEVVMIASLQERDALSQHPAWSRCNFPSLFVIYCVWGRQLRGRFPSRAGLPLLQPQRLSSAALQEGGWHPVTVTVTVTGPPTWTPR